MYKHTLERLSCERNLKISTCEIWSSMAKCVSRGQIEASQQRERKRSIQRQELIEVLTFWWVCVKRGPADSQSAVRYCIQPGSGSRALTPASHHFALFVSSVPPFLQPSIPHKHPPTHQTHKHAHARTEHRRKHSPRRKKHPHKHKYISACAG